MFNDQQFNNGNANLDDRYKSMSKDAVYAMAVNQGKELPSIDARCSTKPYCQEAVEGRVYTVRKSDLMMFEARLTPMELKKSAFYSIGALVPQLDRLLELKGRPRFGFPEGTLPDDFWFSRILR